MQREILQKHYDQIADKRSGFLKTHQYYYEHLYRYYRYLVPANQKVLEVGSGRGDLLAALKPGIGVGLDISSGMVALAKETYPHLDFRFGSIEVLREDEVFDVIILSGVIGELDDIQSFLIALKPHCHSRTRIIIEYYSYLWQSLMNLAQKVGMKMKTLEQNWLTASDIDNFLHLSGYEVIKKEKTTLFPIGIWGLSTLLNKYVGRLPGINALTLNHFIIARPLISQRREYTVSIIVPCRNEKGNIEAALTRTPIFGRHQEFIFIEGHSKDGTYEEVERVIQAYPDKDIKLWRQAGVGKGDAVRLGFEKAQGELLMILDADLTTCPEDMPKFYDAIAQGQGEFINGCRLIYPMEDEAMRFLNLCANKMFGIFFTWLLGQRFKDTLCGTKVLLKRDYDVIAHQRHYFGDFDPFGDFDLIFGAVKSNLKVIEMPIRYKNRIYGTTQIQRSRHGLLLFRMCWFALRKIKFI